MNTLDKLNEVQQVVLFNKGTATHTKTIWMFSEGADWSWIFPLRDTWSVVVTC